MKGYTVFGRLLRILLMFTEVVYVQGFAALLMVEHGH